MTTEARQATSERKVRRPPRWLSWKKGSVRLGPAVAEGIRAAKDVRHLLSFRVNGRRGKGATIALGVLLAVTLLVSFVPAIVPDIGMSCCFVARRMNVILSFGVPRPNKKVMTKACGKRILAPYTNPFRHAYAPKHPSVYRIET